MSKELNEGKLTDNVSDGDDILTVEMEDGVERKCQILSVFWSEEMNQEYVALMPLDQLDGLEMEDGEEMEVEADVYFYKYYNDDGMIELEGLESEEELHLVSYAFEQIMED